MDRAERRRKTERIIKRRMRNGEHLVLPRDSEEQPHRLHKNKPSFTSGCSLKSYKQVENRKRRRASNMATDNGEEPPMFSKDSVRWNYW